MKQLSNNELRETYGGNSGWATVIVENIKDITDSAIALYNNVRDSIRDWGHTAGCKKYHPCE